MLICGVKHHICLKWSTKLYKVNIHPLPKLHISLPQSYPQYWISKCSAALRSSTQHPQMSASLPAYPEFRLGPGSLPIPPAFAESNVSVLLGKTPRQERRKRKKKGAQNISWVSCPHLKGRWYAAGLAKAGNWALSTRAEKRSSFYVHLRSPFMYAIWSTSRHTSN